MFKFKKLLIFLIIGNTSMYSQDPASFFPYGDGDFIQYLFYNWDGYDTLQATTIVDSTDSDGNVYITRDFWFLNPVRKDHNFDIERYKIDTLNQVHAIRISSGEWIEELYYDLNADTNEIWINADLGAGYEFALVREEYPDTLFNVHVTVKEIDFFAADDTSRDGVWSGLYTEKLAAGFGLTYRGGSSELGYFIWMTGARINNIDYGDIVVSIKDDASQAPPQNINLYQNYPNPFNPRTTIAFQLKKKTNLTLHIFDINGRLFRKLIDNHILNRGVHRFIWDGKTDKGVDAASGTYFYKLKTGQFSFTKKMQLIR